MLQLVHQTVRNLRSNSIECLPRVDLSMLLCPLFSLKNPVIFLSKQNNEKGAKNQTAQEKTAKACCRIKLMSRVIYGEGQAMRSGSGTVLMLESIALNARLKTLIIVPV